MSDLLNQVVVIIMEHHLDGFVESRIHARCLSIEIPLCIINLNVDPF